jgi:hypothetical protein
MGGVPTGTSVGDDVRLPVLVVRACTGVACGGNVGDDWRLVNSGGGNATGNECEAAMPLWLPPPQTLPVAAPTTLPTLPPLPLCTPTPPLVG